MNKTPRILEVVLGARLMPLSKATSVENWFLIVLGPNMINSVVSVFTVTVGNFWSSRNYVFEAGPKFQELIGLVWLE